jgi:hypothetical protein
VSILSISDDSKNKILVELVGPNSQGAWRYQYRILSPNGAVSSVQATFPFDDTFVNFFWADYDQVNQKLYILSGDENSLFTLRCAPLTCAADLHTPLLAGLYANALRRCVDCVHRVKLFVADLKAKTVSNVMVDNSRYTLTNVHVVRHNLSPLTPPPLHSTNDHPFACAAPFWRHCGVVARSVQRQRRARDLVARQD